MRNLGWLIGWGVVLGLLGISGHARAEDYRVGVGRADITPDGPIWLSGYGSRNKPSEGVEQKLFVKALALKYRKESPLLLITADIISFPGPVAEAIAGRIRKEFKVPRANIMLIGSHTHAGPVIYSGRTKLLDLKAKPRKAVKAYAKKLQDQAFAAASAALKKLTPAKLSFGRGQAHFAANRRVFTSKGVQFGVNPNGVVDHDVPVLRIDDPKGEVRAIVFGYACHCTTLDGDYYRVCGDWAGYAQDYLERAHPGATAFFVTGCGGDANPAPRGKIAHARQHGLDMAGAVSRVLKGRRTAVTGPVKTALEWVDLPLAKAPTEAEFRKRLLDRNLFIRRHARRQLDILEKGGKLPTKVPSPVQVWQFGKDLTLVAMGGEVVVDYALRLKRELRGGNLWVAGYANDVFGYVPSVRVLIEGGYEADFNLILYGLPTRFHNDVEETLIKKVHALVKKVRS
jgi:hypothetical protein